MVIVPVDRSVKLTISGRTPLVGVAAKFATGITAPIPTTELVLPPSFAVTNTIELLKVPALAGVNVI